MKEGTNVNNTNMRKECEVLWAKNKYYEAIKANRANFIQLNKNRDGKILY